LGCRLSRTFIITTASPAASTPQQFILQFCPETALLAAETPRTDMAMAIISDERHRSAMF
jgi:hypothetical protein